MCVFLKVTFKVTLPFGELFECFFQPPNNGNRRSPATIFTKPLCFLTPLNSSLNQRSTRFLSKKNCMKIHLWFCFSVEFSNTKIFWDSAFLEHLYMILDFQLQKGFQKIPPFFGFRWGRFHQLGGVSSQCWHKSSTGKSRGWLQVDHNPKLYLEPISYWKWRNCVEKNPTSTKVTSGTGGFKYFFYLHTDPWGRIPILP